MVQKCSDCGVRDRALCGSLDELALAEVATIGQQRHLERGEALVRQGDASILCANVQSGVLKIGTVDQDGAEAIVGLLYAGDFAGQPFPGEQAFDITALTETDLCVFPRAGFERLLAGHHAMEHLLLERTFADLQRARGWLAKVARGSALARVASFLDDMAQRMAVGDCRRGGGIPPGARFELPLRRGEIADLLGLTIETVSRQITRLRAAGVIDLPGGRGIIVRDPAALSAAALG